MGRDRTRKRLVVPPACTLPIAKVDKAVMGYLIGHLKDLYVTHKQLLQLRLHGHGDYQIRGRQQTVFDKNGTWEAAVRFFVGHKLSMDRCLQARFALVRSEAQSVFPNMLALDKYLDLYREACRSLPEEMQQEFANQQERCYDRLMITTADLQVERPRADPAELGKVALNRVLLNSQLELSPLFRYCLAYDNGLDWIAEHFYEAAHRQYLLAPRLHREIWGKWIPEVLIKTVHNQTRGYHD